MNINNHVIILLRMYHQTNQQVPKQSQTYTELTGSRKSASHYTQSARNSLAKRILITQPAVSQLSLQNEQ